MGTEEEYTLEVKLADMPQGWVLFAIGKEQPCIAPPPVRERIKGLLELERMWGEYVRAVADREEAIGLRDGAGLRP